MRTSTTLALGLAACAGAQAETATYAIDPAHTFAYFEVLHRGTSTLRGRFDRKQGSVAFDRAGRTGRVEVTIEMSSIDTGIAALDKRLQQDDFLAAAAYPTATFVGDAFGFVGDKVSEVSGTLTLRGQSHPVTLKASHFNCYLNPVLKREVCGGDFQTTIQRSLWGVSYGLPAMVPDTVGLQIQVEAIRQEER